LAILPLALFMLSVVKPVHVEGGASSFCGVKMNCSSRCRMLSASHTSPLPSFPETAPG